MLYVLIIVLLVIDQLSKYEIKNILQLGESISIIPNVFNLTYIQNRGAAFGFMQNKQIIFVIIAIIMFGIGIYCIQQKKYNKMEKFSISLIVAGACGNALDRIFNGYVTDFIDFRFIWKYIFNIADIYIVVGVIIFIIANIKKEYDIKNKN